VKAQVLEQHARLTGAGASAVGGEAEEEEWGGERSERSERRRRQRRE